MANDTTAIAAIMQVVTRDWRGTVRTSSAQVRAFENQLKSLNSIPGVNVRLAAQGASLAMGGAAEITATVKKTMDRELGQALVKSLNIVPVRTGKLKSSARLVKARRRGDSVTGSVRYGESDGVDYALYVHEDVTASHSAPTQAKFLEQAMIDVSPGMEKRFAAAVKTYLESL